MGGVQACPCGHAEKIISTIVHDAARSPVSKSPDALLDADTGPTLIAGAAAHPINADNLGQLGKGAAVDSSGHRWSLSSEDGDAEDPVIKAENDEAIREKKVLRISQNMVRDGISARLSCIMEGTGAGLLTPMCYSVTDAGVTDEDLKDGEENEDEENNDCVIVMPEEEQLPKATVAREKVNKRASTDQCECINKIRPDFTGKWKMVKYDGDWDGFMKEMGVGWAFRTAASAVGYGVNKTYHNVVQSVERIQIETKNPKGTFIKDYAIDATEQDDVDPIDKGPIKVVPYWHWNENDHVAILVVEAFKPRPNGEDPYQMPITRRYLGENAQNVHMPNWMILEQVTPKGITASRCFERQGGDPTLN